jgi:two-component system OmpR family response regulator
MSSEINILIVDDDPEIGELLQGYLQKQNFNVITRQDGVDILEVIAVHDVNLVVLDVMLPGEDGLSLCRKIREKSAVMIIMLSAMGEDTDKIVGLEMGADDYLAKPFSPRELLARIKSLVRRTSGEMGAQREQEKLVKVTNIKFANWTLDRNKRKLIAPDAVTIPLTNGEYELLLALLENANRVLSRDQLLNITHNRDAGPFDRTIDVQVGRIRKKIETDAKNPSFIETVRGGGYQFNADVSYE